MGMRCKASPKRIRSATDWQSAYATQGAAMITNLKLLITTDREHLRHAIQQTATASARTVRSRALAPHTARSKARHSNAKTLRMAHSHSRSSSLTGAMPSCFLSSSLSRASMFGVSLVSTWPQHTRPEPTHCMQTTHTHTHLAHDARHDVRPVT
eukprot:1790102-Rhodomonas_salina.9